MLTVRIDRLANSCILCTISHRDDKFVSIVRLAIRWREITKRALNRTELDNHSTSLLSST